MSNGPETLYTAEGTAVGGREGHSRTSDGRLDVDLDVPAEMGGTCGLGTNPEQLLAAGWAACFQSSMQRFAFACKVDLSDSRVTSRVGIGTLESGGFGLAAALDFHAPQVSRADAVELMRRARAQGLPLLTGDARQHRGHAHRRRHERRAAGSLIATSHTAVVAQLRRPLLIVKAGGSRDSRASGGLGFSPRTTGRRSARRGRAG
jgi:lipoyl-dependent peroxiredoxin